MRTPLKYMGGKQAAFEKIVPHFPPNLKEIISPFFGGGGLEFVLAESGARIHGSDYSGYVANFWKYALSVPKDLKARINKHWQSELTIVDIKRMRYLMLEHEVRDNLDRAAFYFLLNRMSRLGQAFDGGIASRGFTKACLDYFEQPPMRNITVKYSSYWDALDDSTFAYLDPPYPIGDATIGKGKHYYDTHKKELHRDFDHEHLHEIVADRPRWIMSNMNCQFIRDLYVDHKIIDVYWRYGSATDKNAPELLIFSKDLAPNRNFLSL